MMLISIVILVSLLEITSSQETRDRNQLRRRCFTCRSRGEKGDCRDPFTPPEREEGAERRSSVNTAVAEADCSTGWCSKVKIISDDAMINDSINCFRSWRVWTRTLETMTMVLQLRDSVWRELPVMIRSAAHSFRWVTRKSTCASAREISATMLIPTIQQEFSSSCLSYQ